jgi:hypothetical protein
MERRGDDRFLPTTKGKNLWGYLNRMYVDPNYARLRMPDSIRRVAPMYKGYDECVRVARREGLERLREIYGPDADVSIVTELKSRDKTNYDKIGASFVGLLKNK